MEHGQELARDEGYRGEGTSIGIAGAGRLSGLQQPMKQRVQQENVAETNRQIASEALSIQRIINSRLLEAIGRASGGVPDSEGPGKRVDPPRSSGTLHAIRETLTDLSQEQNVTTNLLSALDQLI